MSPLELQREAGALQTVVPAAAPTPMENLCAVVGAAAMMFYWAE
jgi:hypothetical protein